MSTYSCTIIIHIIVVAGSCLTLLSCAPCHPPGWSQEKVELRTREEFQKAKANQRLDMNLERSRAKEELREAQDLAGDAMKRLESMLNEHQKEMEKMKLDIVKVRVPLPSGVLRTPRILCGVSAPRRCCWTGRDGGHHICRGARHRGLAAGHGGERKASAQPALVGCPATRARD